MSTSCPHSAHGRRKTARPGEPLAPDVEVVDGIWHLRSHDLVKQVLRAGRTTQQAGFNSDMARAHTTAMKDPILFMDGDEHRRQRSMIARYFAPATVSRRYRELMEVRAERLVTEVRTALEAGRTVDLSDLGLQYSVEVAAQVIGLTESDIDGMARRLERVFTVPAQLPESRIEDDKADPTEPSTQTAGQDDPDPGQRRDLRARVVSRAGAVVDRFAAVYGNARATLPTTLFYLKDVKPAIAARRLEPDEDVISHLVEQGYSDPEILTECLTYGAAGLVTTREYISIATWHLLGDPELRERYTSADEPERYRILHEILRLEPVVGSLYRRATEPMTLTDGDTEHHIPKGAVMALSIRAANADPDAVGEDPLGLCPARDLASGTKPEAMSFGDGNHRCPGNALAIQETDILLTRLLALPLVLKNDPSIGWLDLIAGYELRGVDLATTP